MSFFSSIIQFFGLLGLFKYILDQATMNAIRQMILVLNNLAQSNSSALPDVEKKRLLTEVSHQLWDQTVGQPADPQTTHGFIMA